MLSPIAILSLVIICASILLIHGRIRPDLIALCALVTLGLTDIVSVQEAFSGFGSPAVITILAISVISEGLQQTGITRFLGRQMFRVAGTQEFRLVLVSCLAAAVLSMFMNNIAAAGVLMPAVIGLSRQTRTPPSKLLMPMAFGTILGGMATLLTTSNIIVSSALREAGFRPFGLLDFLPIGLPVIAVGTLFLAFYGRRMLPQKYPAGQAARERRLRAELESLYGIRKNLFEVEVLEGSCMDGLSLREGDWARRLGINIIGIRRSGKILIGPGRNEIVHVGDVLMAQGKPVPAAAEGCGLKVLASLHQSMDMTDDNIQLGELVLSPRATVAGKTLRDLHFREKFRLNVLAIWRKGAPLREGLADIPLQYGDALLVQGSLFQMRLLRDERDFLLLEEDTEAIPHRRKAGIAAVITLSVLTIAAVGWLPVAEISLLGAILMVLSGCLTMDDAYQSVEWRAIFLIAGMWPVGLAMRSTGLADAISNLIVQNAAGLPALMLGVILLGSGLLLAQLLGGQVASIVLAPIGLTIAALLGTDPHALAMAVALGCSLVFVTPLGHPVNILVMGSGGYSFRDYLRVGGVLTILVLLVTVLGLHYFWGL